ncbi:glycoside hydrolase family 15 protein [Rubrobacter marinus]|uniref:Glycoside hydrolase family 15 protein n=1 Tax=Rubrobacter marinus TaxID=2653852 RepID=A0A6G8Q223_9ACTN|nr:glycoside hydrolase family 15 protein [Rubrobacter marinus]QIN80509.1 glycoside hydrolase family 15 protein [Rubrobacter marinus]
MDRDRSVGDYGLLSDCQTAALVGRDGSVDWYCPPRFDAPSVFARLLDEGGGHWSIRPTGAFESERAYLEDGMVLRTEFSAGGGRAALTDALALEEGARGHEIGRRSPHVLLRRIEGLEGEVEVEVEFVPRLEYGLTRPLLRAPDGGTRIVARAGPTELHLFAGRPLDVAGTEAGGRFVVRAGESVDFALAYGRAAGRIGEPPAPDVGAALENAREGWASWSGMHKGYEGPYKSEVHRSALVLQALTYVPSGGIVAAPTTSLPAVEGGEDNWDYRYAWLRDLSLVLRALWVAACPDEAEWFFYWIDRAGGGCPSGQLQIMYGVEGERDLTEHLLGHLEGFRGSGPVRVGNDAWSQSQLDVYGEVLDAAYLLRDGLGEEFDPATARLLRVLADGAAGGWREPDSGMWEARDAQRHYLSSKLMCWVALDRAVKLAPRLGEEADVSRWKGAREEVRRAILEEGWNEGAGAYTGAFGSERLDASVLLMPLVGFLPAEDERMEATIRKIQDELAPDGLVHRWAGDPNGFLLCTYWLVECLARSGRIEDAVELFERTGARANDLGLLAEQADARTGELRGNFPQAFSHVGLVNAAWRLSQAGVE